LQSHAGLWPVLMDPSQVDQILANLCVNSRDAIADIGTVTIETSNQSFDEEFCNSNPEFERGDYVESGCGMDADTLSRIFEPFFTTKREGKGTGLGLATVYGIVKQNRGFLKVLSAPQEGTAVSVYLPRHQGNVGPSFVDTPRAQERGTETLLLVDDDATVLRLTTRLLKKLGYYTLQASSPSEALRIVREYTGEIHLLLTDVVMPEMNGRKLASQLISLQPAMKCLFMSGHTAEVITHDGVLDAGISFIQKPFTLQNLATKVRKLLDEPRVINVSSRSNFKSG
jgi:CheY-like chemotaxis protein